MLGFEMGILEKQLQNLKETGCENKRLFEAPIVPRSS
jgi:hypothetical protein